MTDLVIERRRVGAVEIAIPPTRARRARALPTLGFALVWNGFLVVWYLLASRVRGGSFGILFWFPVLHVAAGLGMIASVVRDLFGTIAIEIGVDRLVLFARPLPLTPRLEVRVGPAVRAVAVEGNGSWEIELVDERLQVRLPVAMSTEHDAHVLAAIVERGIERVHGEARYR